MTICLEIVCDRCELKTIPERHYFKQVDKKFTIAPYQIGKPISRL